MWGDLWPLDGGSLTDLPTHFTLKTPISTHFTPKNTLFTHPFTHRTMNENFIFILAILFVGAILLSAYILDSAEGEG
jgi:hypothetical protein